MIIQYLENQIFLLLQFLIIGGHNEMLPDCSYLLFYIIYELAYYFAIVHYELAYIHLRK